MESKRSKYILIGLSVFCILLIGITSFKDGFLNPLRSGVGYVLNPIQSGVNRVGTSLYNGISNYSTLHSAMAEKQALQERIDALVEENSRLQSEQFELQRLRELYDLDQDYMQYQKIGARVIAKDSGDWFQVFQINQGLCGRCSRGCQCDRRRRPRGNCHGCWSPLRHGTFHYR